MQFLALNKIKYTKTDLANKCFENIIKDRRIKDLDKQLELIKAAREFEGKINRVWAIE